MKIFYLYILFIYTGLIKGQDLEIKQKYEKCSLEKFQKPFDVLPGTGWDNLENVEMGRILDLNFSKCLFSNDNKYLIPNYLSITPEKISHLELFSETFNHYSKYTSMTSKSINVQADGAFHDFKMGGSFSYENSQIKNDQLESKSMISRVQLRYTVFQPRFQPDSALYPKFRNRIMDIAGLLAENHDSLYPAYLADMIIRDYGTHVIRSLDAGAILSKTDALDSTYVTQYQSDSTSIKASASASFLSFFGMSAKFQTKATTEQVNTYNHNCAKTHIDAIGGTLIGANFSLQKWEESVLNNLVAIDRRGEPIYYVITPRTLPELDDITVNQLYNLLKAAVDRYYTRNMRRGCLDIHSPNFNIDANVDAKNCKSPIVNFTLGGVYQKCTGESSHCGGVSQINPLTGGYTCPNGFHAIKLHYGLNRCEQFCSGWWLWRHCDTRCSFFESGWCHPKETGLNHNGYRFGGIISKLMTVCPLGYIRLKVGTNIRICVTTDPDPNNPFAINFGGFYSCKVGNPLARYFVKNRKKLVQSVPFVDLTYWPKSCTDGYTSNIAGVDRGCQISYCTETNKVSLGALPDLIKPPFIELNYNPNSTKVFIFKNSKGEIYAKDSYGSWNLNEIQDRNRKTLIGSILGTIGFIMVVSFVVIFLQRRHYRYQLSIISKTVSQSEPCITRYGSINTPETA